MRNKPFTLNIFKMFTTMVFITFLYFWKAHDWVMLILSRECIEIKLYRCSHIVDLITRITHLYGLKKGTILPRCMLRYFRKKTSQIRGRCNRSKTKYHYVTNAAPAPPDPKRCNTLYSYM